MPQLDFATFPNQIFWLVVTLVVIYLILSRVALPRIGAVLAERRGTITNDLDRGRDLKLQAVEAEAAYQQGACRCAKAEAQRIVAAARAEVQEELDAAIAHADAEIAAKTAESEKRIAVIRDSASAAVSEVARDVAGDIVRAMGGTSDAAAIDAAVCERVKGVGP
jgi:F-type H+-transporting ATPase subunit b